MRSDARKKLTSQCAQPDVDPWAAKGLHDLPSIFPQLPPRAFDPAMFDNYAPEGDPFRAAWEFKLSHTLSESEGSAFWHGVNIQHKSSKALVAVQAEQISELERANDQRADTAFLVGCNHGRSTTEAALVEAQREVLRVGEYADAESARAESAEAERDADRAALRGLREGIEALADHYDIACAPKTADRLRALAGGDA